MPRPKATRCKRGHKLTEATRYYFRGRAWGCLLCRRATASAHHQRKKPKRRLDGVYASIDATPLIAHLDRARMEFNETARVVSLRLGSTFGATSRALARMRQTGLVTVAMADDICVGLGRHPAEIFGPVWFTYGTEEVADAV